MGSGRVRTSAKFTLLAAVAAVASGLTATAALGTQGHVAAAARQYTLTIRGVDRNGKRVAIEPTVFGATNGHDYLTYLSKVTVPAGQYVVAAPITAAADHGNQTLVAKVVRVRSTTTVTLSAVGAVPVRATLNVPAGVTQRNQSVMLCVKGAGHLNGVTGLLVPVGMSKGVITPGTVYVKPMTGSGLRFVYQTYWTEPSLLQVYDEAAAYNGGIPAHPSYSQRLGGLAHVNVELRANENSAPLRNVIETYDGCGSLTLPEYNLPESYTDDRTPGTWLTGLAFGPSGTTITREIDKTSAYSAGLNYLDILGSAVEEPGAVYPVMNGSAITYAAGDFFADPLQPGGRDCEGSGRETLARGTATVSSVRVVLCGKNATFRAKGTRAGWYTLTVNLSRPPAAKSETLLSPAVSLTWRFYDKPSARGPEAAPVTVTEFSPENLDSSNNAKDGSTTTVQVVVRRGGGQKVATPRYPLTSVQVQVSDNNGKTWRAVTLVKHGGSWLATIANPAGGGYVSLRSVVTDSHGNRTTETVNRAYLVSNGQ
jgi:hypothetical protein